MWSRIIDNLCVLIFVFSCTYMCIPFSTKKLVPILSYHTCMLQCVLLSVLHIIHVQVTWIHWTSVRITTSTHQGRSHIQTCSSLMLVHQMLCELHDFLFMYVPTPERCLKVKLKRAKFRKVAFMDLAEHEKIMLVVNSVWGCKTPNCTGKLIPVELKSAGLGGSLSIRIGQKVIHYY